MSELQKAHGLLPLRMCDACQYKSLEAKLKGDGWCFMFKEEPKSAYCAQFDLDENSPFAAHSQTKEGS